MANKFHSKVISLIRWMAGLCLAATPLSAQELEQRDSHQAATGFAETIETLIETMPVEQESFEVRINRCATPQGAMRDDVYAVWIGTRLVTIGDEHADDIIAEQARRWREKGWDISRDRQLEGGGANLAAIDPDSGNSYSLDSGFAPEPERYILGFFSTACFEEPSGTVPFGPVKD
jgi:hypothetical protein